MLLSRWLISRLFIILSSSFSHVVFIIPTPSLKRTHDHKKRWNRRSAFFVDNKDGLHNTRSANSLTLGARCQFSQTIHDFSQEIWCTLKLEYHLSLDTTKLFARHLPKTVNIIYRIPLVLNTSICFAYVACSVL